MSSKLDALTNLTKPKHGLQLCLYTLFFEAQYGQLPAEARIESLINVAEDFALSYDKNTDLSVIPKLFEDGMQALVGQLLDTEIPFEHNPEAKYCQFCT